MASIRKNTLHLLVILFLAIPGLMAKGPAVTTGSFKTQFTSDLMTIIPSGEFARFDLTIQGPDGYTYQESFSGMEIPFIETFGPDGMVLTDGLYTYRLVGVPVISKEVQQAMAHARESGDQSELRAMKAAGSLPQGEVITGNFRIHHSLIMDPNSIEIDNTLLDGAIIEATEGRDGNDRPGTPTGGDDSGATTDSGSHDFDEDSRAQTFTTDLIVQGSACVGLDCTSSESFGFETLRLKENNLRIKFLDTSASASFPDVDWQLTANDSTNGGANRFSIEDTTNNKNPFTIEANAPNNTLYVDSTGRIGVRQVNPVVEVHVTDGDSPTLRLEQDGSSGFTPQTWDLAGNETNFFVRDVTNGSKLPLKIVPGAPTDTLYVASSGNIGIGHANPSSTLHMKDTANAIVMKMEGEDPSMCIERTSSTTNNSAIQLDLVNNGQVNLRYNNNNGGTTRIWNTGVDNSNQYFISAQGTGAFEFLMDTSGNITTTGTVNGTSDINMKKDFEPISPENVLAKIADMPVTTWTYKHDKAGERHMGPMAQDFYAAFGLGKDERHISYTDATGVAFGAIKGLNQLVEEMKAKLDAQEARIKELEAQLQK